MRYVFNTLMFFCLMMPLSFANDNQIRLLVRGDDIGSSHAANVACIKTYQEGIVRSVEVMVPCPWFPQAVKMLNDNPGLDVGVHLTLTSEWENIKWGPLTQSNSIVDALGHFVPRTSSSSNSIQGFLQLPYKMDEVEKELRAQIETAINRIPAVSHLTSHMGTPVSSPKLRKLTQRLADEYGLPLDAPMAKRPPRFSGKEFSPEQKEANLVNVLENLQPGLWLIVEHPGLDTPEMRSITHKGYENVAHDRAGVTYAFTSDKVKEVIKRRGIKLVSYADVYKALETQ